MVPTVTDANLLLGRLDPRRFLGGGMRLDVARAERAVDGLARSLRVSRTAAAEGTIQVANAAMARALRVISVERGHDPRDFVLVAFGGAAGVHACDLAVELDMREVMIPEHPGLLSAVGIAEATLARDFALTVRLVDPSARELARRMGSLRRQGTDELRRQGVPSSQLIAETLAQVRYLGQAHEIEIPLRHDYRRRFDAAHARLYGHADASRSIEVVALRLALTTRDTTPVRVRRAPRPRRAPRGEPHTIVWQGRRLRVPRYERESLSVGTRLQGPCLLVEYSSTVLVPPGWAGGVDADANLRFTRRSRR